MVDRLSSRKLAERLKPLARTKLISTHRLTPLERRAFVERRHRRVYGRTVEDVQTRSFRGREIQVKQTPKQAIVVIPKTEEVFVTKKRGDTGIETLVDKIDWFA